MRIDFSIFVSKKSQGKYETPKMDLRGRQTSLFTLDYQRKEKVDYRTLLDSPSIHSRLYSNAYCDCILSGSFDK